MFGDKIITPRVKRMASPDPLGGQPRPSQGAVALHGLEGVLRAGGLEPAVRAQIGAYQFLVNPDRSAEDAPGDRGDESDHRSSRARSSQPRSSGNGAFSALRLAMIT